VTPEEAIKDPFVLEFLDLKDDYSESDLEALRPHRWQRVGPRSRSQYPGARERE
jgi:predicted nuclease of restriction endonuclease-like (RecB) superfamily